MTRAFHILVSLLVALPLGAGGLCCCLLGAADAALEQVVAEPVHPCCPAEGAPIEPGQSRPDRSGSEDCGCPVRDTALFAASSGGSLLPLPAPAGDAIAPRSEPAVLVDAPELDGSPRAAQPSRKRPLYRTLSALLC